MVAGPLDRFATQPAMAPYLAGQQGIGAMTPKISKFLAENIPATPCLVVDVDEVENRYRALQVALPLARIYYAVKANPA